MKLQIIKFIIFLEIVLITKVSLANESQVGSNHLQLLTSKCEIDIESGIDTSPQSPPLDIDDPGTPGCNRWEINILTSADINPLGKTYEVPLIDINYGIGDNLQIKYEVPLIKTDSESTSQNNTVGNSVFGTKFMFYNNEESKLELSIYPQYEFVTHNTSDSEINQTNGSVLYLPLLLSKKIGELTKGDVMMSVNFGYRHSNKLDESMDSVLAAIGFGAPITGSLSIMSELSTEQGLQKNSNDIRDELVKTQIGSVYSITKNFFIYGSLGKSLKSSDEQIHTYSVAGIRIITNGFN